MSNGSATPTIFTIGHSTRSLGELIALLRENAIERLVDVRAVPHSRHNPQFNAGTLETVLPAAGMGYGNDKALGGMRGASRKASPNLFWKAGGFRNFADYAMTQPFRAALATIEEAGREQRLAIMCAEAHWTHCHRRIIADYLLTDGYAVSHILDVGKTEPATLTPAAVRGESGTLVYPADPAAPELPGL